MISLLFIFLASFFNGVANRITYPHFKRSIFRNLLPCFWDRKVSAECTRKYFGFPLDAWFFAQILMVISVALSIVLYSPIYSPVVDFFIYVGFWKMNSDTFYKLILRKRR